MMWIRSQDKESLGQYTRFEIVTRELMTHEEIKNEYMITGGTPYQDYGHLLGAYSTMQKALNVLDDIENTMCFVDDIYQMPRDDEVEDDENKN